MSELPTSRRHPRRSYPPSRILFTVLILVSLIGLISAAEDSPPPETTSSAKENEIPKEPKKVVKEEDDFDAENEDWGMYYDPQNIFCGKFDCYKILGFDYESFGRKHPDTKEITKRYRQLSRVWHPDKSKKKNAKSKFVKISRAYEVLTSEALRKEYDFLRYNQEAYFNKYGTFILRSYAPKSDTVIVIIFILVLANIFSWYSQKHRWQLVADRLAKAAIEDWTPSQGGTPESKQLREQALLILNTDMSTEPQEAETNGVANPKASPKKKPSFSAKSGKNKDKKDKKRQELEALVPIIKALVNDMEDFGGGFHKPTWRDLFIVSLAKFPYTLAVGTKWQVKYWFRRLQNKELNDEEMEVLTERAVGRVLWDTSSEEDRKEMVSRKLWILENLVEWNEEQEIKKLSAADQKLYWKLKKKGQLDKYDKVE